MTVPKVEPSLGHDLAVCCLGSFCAGQTVRFRSLTGLWRAT